jgi:curved DNA-binding protein CbpA
MNMNLEVSSRWFGLQNMKGVTLDDLKKRYHHLAQMYHPDKGGSSDDFIKLREAYTFLQDYIANPKTEENQNSKPKTDFDDVSKELERYKKAFANSQVKIHEYEAMITSQINLISSFQSNLQSGITFGKNQDGRLRSVLDEELDKLKKKYNSSWWKQPLGIKTMTETEYNYQYNTLIYEFNGIKQKQDDEYIDNLLTLYRGLVNQIVDIINTV